MVPKRCSKPYFKLNCVKAPDWGIKGAKASVDSFFFSVNTSGAGGTNSKALKPSGSDGPEQEMRGSHTKILELLMLKHDRAYVSVDSEESMSVCV